MTNTTCALCAADGDLSTYEVTPTGTDDNEIMVCETCQTQINDPATMDSNHWRCLNDSMWTPVAAVQVMAWRLLKKLTQKGENWAQDLLDTLYLEEDVQTWAEQGIEGDEEEDDDTTPTRDSNGTILQAGDTVTLIKDLDVKGAGFTAKRGVTVKNISLTNNPEHIEGRVNGVHIVLVSAYLKKVA